MTDTPVALVTGAARGIGFGIAERLVLDGWRVILADIDRAGVRSAADHVEPAADATTLDVRDEPGIRALLAQLRQHQGRLDALVNNAGISDPHCGPIESLGLTDWNRWLETNLTGPFLMCKHALPLLCEQRGAIVNIASTRALQSEPHTEVGPSQPVDPEGNQGEKTPRISPWRAVFGVKNTTPREECPFEVLMRLGVGWRS